MNHDHDDPFSTEEGALFWEEWADVLESGLARVSQALLDAAHVGQATRTLDLACGLGHASRTAATRGAQVTGLDLNPAMLARAKPAPGTTFVEGDMLRPPKGPWDAIISRFGAHHAPAAWVPAAANVLAPRGRLAIAEWHPETALFATEDEYNGPTEDTAQDWEERFRAAGLREVESQDVEFTIDFGHATDYARFLEAMHQTPAGGAPDGKQVNRAYIVAGIR